MSEKIVIVKGSTFYHKEVAEINQMLASGWTVKFVNMAATKDEMMTVYVFKKED